MAQVFPAAISPFLAHSLVQALRKRFGEAIGEIAGWLQSGDLVYEEDVQHGLENAPKTFQRLFEGKNLGKQLLKVADPPLGS